MKLTKEIIKNIIIEELEGMKNIPGVSVTKSVQKKSKEFNDGYQKDITKKFGDLDRDLKSDMTDNMKPVKRNLSDEEQDYHNEVEILNGMEMLNYDGGVDDKFEERQKMAIEGDTKMGNKTSTGKWDPKTGEGNGNTESVWGASDNEFGKKLVDTIEKSNKKRKDAVQTLAQLGDDIETTKGKNVIQSKKIGIGENTEEKEVSKPTKLRSVKVTYENGDVVPTNMAANITDDEIYNYFKVGKTFNIGLGPKDNLTKVAKVEILENDINEYGKPRSLMADRNYTHFAIYKPTNQIMNGWNYKGYDSEELKSEKAHYFFNDLSDMYDDFKTLKKDIKIVNRKSLDNSGIDPEVKENWYGYTLNNPKETEEIKIENNNEITETKMKRLKFKNLFNGVNNAIKLIPETYKVENKVFEMCDGNETFKIRWEKNKPVVLESRNQIKITEDMDKIKKLFNYNSRDSFGTLKAGERIIESETFYSLLDKSKNMIIENDGENIKISGKPELEMDAEEVEVGKEKVGDASGKNEIPKCTLEKKGTELEMDAKEVESGKEKTE